MRAFCAFSLLVLLSAAGLSPASAAMRLVSATGPLTAGGRELVAGDVVKAGVELKLSSGTALFATDAGRFLLKGPAAFTPERSSLFLRLGGLLSVLPKLGRRRFEVRTANAVAAVRGTDFFIEARGKNASYICVCQGKLETSADGLDPAPLEAKHHRAVLIETGKTGPSRKSAPQENHDDSELDALRDALK